MKFATSGFGRRVLGTTAVIVLASSRLAGQQVLAEWDSQHATSADDWFGNDVASLGDVNGDGWPDVLVGAYGYDSGSVTNENGAAFVVSTKDGSFLRQHVGNNPVGRFGWSLDGGPDLDGDGIADYAIGAPYEYGLQLNSGRVHVYSGATGSVLYVIDGQGLGEGFGHDLSFVGDLDGDGTEDFVANADNWHNQPLGTYSCGRIYCYSGRTGATLWTHDGTQWNQWLSWCCPLDDWNGDGIPDVGAGSIGGGSGVAGEGTFDVVDGRTGLSLARINGENTNDAFGFCGRTGDIDRDGMRDLLIGAPNWSGKYVQAGRLYLVSGATLAVLRRFDGERDYEGVGSWSVSFGDVDVNGDGWDDFVFGTKYRLRPGCALGVHSFYCGRTMRLLHETRAQWQHGIDHGLGMAAAPIPDVDADGWPDAVVSSYAAGGAGGNFPGRVYLMSMKPIFVEGDRSVYQPGYPITVRLSGGTPGVLGMIALVSINGAPRLDVVAFGALDAFGELTHLDVTDASLSGLTIEVQGICQKPSGRGALLSAPETIAFK